MATLYDYFQSLGQPLPSVEQRRQDYGLGAGYTGTAAQNIALLQQLQGGGGQVPQQALIGSPTPTPTTTPGGGGLFSQYQSQLAPITQQSQNLLKDYMALQAQAPTFQQRLLDEIKKAGQYPSAAAMRQEYIQNPNLTPMAIEALVSQRGQTTRGTIQDIINRAYGGFQADVGQKQMAAQLAQQQRSNLLEEYGLARQEQQDIFSKQPTARGTEAERQFSRVRQAATADVKNGMLAEELARKYGGTLDMWELVSIYNDNSPYGTMQESPQTFREWAEGGGLPSWLQRQTQEVPTGDLSTGDWGKYGLDFEGLDFNEDRTVGASGQLIPYTGF
jgi:hypothetical protein